MYINRDRFEQAINDVNQALKDFANSILKLANKVIDSLGKIIAMFPDMDTGTLKKPVFNYPEYKHIKSNTKPYSAYKRLYRVQVR